VVMSRHAFGGWRAGLSFLALSAATAGCAVIGVLYARRRRYERHRRWMLRCYVLICSAVTLRLISGVAGLVGVPSPEGAYIVAAWSSWLLPLAAFEIVERWPARLPAPRGGIRPPNWDEGELSTRPRGGEEVPHYSSSSSA
jgi:hypothetical protein